MRLIPVQITLEHPSKHEQSLQFYTNFYDDGGFDYKHYIGMIWWCACVIILGDGYTMEGDDCELGGTRSQTAKAPKVLTAGIKPKLFCWFTPNRDDKGTENKNIK